MRGIRACSRLITKQTCGNRFFCIVLSNFVSSIVYRVSSCYEFSIMLHFLSLCFTATTFTFRILAGSFQSVVAIANKSQSFSHVIHSGGKIFGVKPSRYCDGRKAKLISLPDIFLDEGFLIFCISFSSQSFHGTASQDPHGSFSTCESN